MAGDGPKLKGVTCDSPRLKGGSTGGSGERVTRDGRRGCVNSGQHGSAMRIWRQKSKGFCQILQILTSVFFTFSVYHGATMHDFDIIR